MGCISRPNGYYPWSDAYRRAEDFLSSIKTIEPHSDVSEFVQAFGNDMNVNILFESPRSESIIHAAGEWANWKVICAGQNLSSAFILEHIQFIIDDQDGAVNHLLERHPITTEIIDALIDGFNDGDEEWLYKSIIENHHAALMSDRAVVSSIHTVDIGEILEQRGPLPDEMIYAIYKDYDECFSGDDSMFVFNTIPEALLRVIFERFIDDIWRYYPWEAIFEYQKVPEDLLRAYMQAYSDDICWEVIFEHQELSEAFMHEFFDCIEWEYIGNNPYITVEFIREHKSKLTMCSNIRSKLIQDQSIRTFMLVDQLPSDAVDAICAFVC